MENAMLHLIEGRRSIRRFQQRPIPDEVLRAVLEAGTWAPTGRGMQSPVIVAVRNPVLLRQLSQMNARVMGSASDPYYGAPTVVLVFAAADRSTHIEDGSCVLQTLMLAAHALGVGSCWIHREREMFATEEGRALMRDWGLADNLVGVGALAMGYAQGETPPPARRKADYIHILD